VGQVRYDKTDDRTAEVDVSIDTAWRGKGFGSEILRLSVAASCRDLGVRHVVAVIKSDNAASLRAFVSAGFVRSHDEIRGGVPCAVLTWSCA
jgi:RimJ/RimL family protein N-acetyltransferase